VGHLTIPIVLAIELHFQPPQWFEFVVYLPILVILTLALLPRCKGVILAALWKTQGEGSELG
jgi:uncharacterized protein (DUF983 family)